MTHTEPPDKILDDENASEALVSRLNDTGVIMLSDTTKLSRASAAANTYIFSVKDRQYIVDPAFGSKRYKQIITAVKPDSSPDILCTHYHNDHSANNGKIAGPDSRIYYHHAIQKKIRYLRTNGTGQILEMARQLDLEDMLKRFKMFPDALVRMLVFSSKFSRRFPLWFLFVISYVYSLNHIGPIYPGRKKASYLEPENMTGMALPHSQIKGWQINETLMAMEAPGHTDDHLVYYLTDKKILFAGDALNFLNANDIQYGEIDQIDKTLNFLLEFVKTKKVEILVQGHYYPIFGTQNIQNYISDIQDKHRQVYEIASTVILGLASPFRFTTLFERVIAHPSPLIQGLGKITFPRSTLVFLDVYLLKALESLGYCKQKNGEWVNL